MFDETSVPKHSESFGMSYAEMKERLCLLRERREKEVDEKRDSIADEKREKTRQILAAAALTKVHRNMVNQVAQQRYAAIA